MSVINKLNICPGCYHMQEPHFFCGRNFSKLFTVVQINGVGFEFGLSDVLFSLLVLVSEYDFGICIWYLSVLLIWAIKLLSKLCFLIKNCINHHYLILNFENGLAQLFH